MDAMGCDEHGLAVAASPKGDVTVAPFTGALTVTSARTGAAQSSASAREQKTFIKSLTVSL
jgi:hypothetical protein